MLNGYSRYMVHWGICPAINEVDIEMIVQRALAKRPRVKSSRRPDSAANNFATSKLPSDARTS